MVAIQRDEYKKISTNMQISFGLKEQCIDIYHKDNWDRFTMHWDEETKNECPSYIDFFFDAKEMVDFIKVFLSKKNFCECFIAPIFNDKYKLKEFDDDICKDIYDEFKRFLNSLGLKVNTSCAIKMSKDELLRWVDRLSLGGFCGVSEYLITIPEEKILIYPHHHMNYLIYAREKEKIIQDISNVISDKIQYDA